MKIVLAHKYFYRGGGTASYLFALMEQLHLRGHQTVPFTVNYEQTVPREYENYYVSPIGGASETHLSDLHSPWAQLKVLARATWSIEAYRKARLLAREEQPDLAFVHNLYSYMSPSPIAAFKRAGLPVVMRVSDYNMLCPGLNVIRDGQPCLECVEAGPRHGLQFRCHKGSYASTLGRVITMMAHNWLKIYENVDLFLTPSQFLRSWLIRAGYPADKIMHLPSFYPVAEQNAHSTDGGYVLYFGRVSEEKGLDTLLDAMALLRRKVPLLIAGADLDGETERLQQRVWRNRLTNVEFLGLQQRAELERLIDGARFTVVPSLWYDNCPMSVFESMARGKPVIGADIGGIPEQITGDCGLLFEPGNAAELAAKMEMLLDDAELREELGLAARRRMQTTYSPESHCSRLLDIFGALLPAEQPQIVRSRAIGAT
ncbi:MAG: glycosyltransferase family 4 protein [Armatimonadota bacterium]